MGTRAPTPNRLSPANAMQSRSVNTLDYTAAPDAPAAALDDNDEDSKAGRAVSLTPEHHTGDSGTDYCVQHHTAPKCCCATQL